MTGSPSPCAQNVDCGVSWRRDTEEIAMLQGGGIEGFFQREFLPYVPDAWVNDGRTKIGDEIRFSRHFSVPDGPGPLTGAAVGQALKRYAAAAGLDPDAVILRSLRYLGAELWYEASENLRETQMSLDHAGLDTSGITMKRLAGEEHRHWEAMVNALGVEV